MTTQPLSSFLLGYPETADLYTRATQSSFLTLAGQGRLPKQILSQWLSQDRLYAQAYLRFIGGLISRVNLPVSPENDTTKTLQWRILSMLKASLDGILVELQFFEKTAKDYGLDLACSENKDFGPNEVTKAYIQLFDAFSVDKEAKSLFQGLVLLWATEKVYLDAWTNAKEKGQTKTAETEDMDGGALRNAFIPNWTAEGFHAFVREIQDCVEAYVVAFPGEYDKRIALEVWKQVLELEVGFWPDVTSKNAATTIRFE